jgi:glycosyltransferase involved in cell wall biosynthesis
MADTPQRRQRPMRVLLVPFNISSQLSVTVRALGALGIEARGLVRNISNIQDHAGVEVMDWVGRPNPAARLWRGVRWRWKMTRALAWADVIHWHWGGSTWKGMDLRLAAWFGKPRLVEFWGDDLRDPARASRDNVFLAHMYEQNPELAVSHSRPTQRLFRQHGFECLLPGVELCDYLEPGVFDGYYQTRQRVPLEDFTPTFPDPQKAQPLLVHAPSHKSRKGTEAVLSAVDRLARRHRFDFKLLHELPRSEALRTVAACDVFLDQFTIGAEGLAALEAMALGKPVVCFIKPSLRARYPDSLPIVLADQDSLAETVAALLADGQRRHDIGVRSRQHVETYHDSRRLAGELMDIYGEMQSRQHSTATGSLPRNEHWRPLPPAEEAGL